MDIWVRDKYSLEFPICFMHYGRVFNNEKQTCSQERFDLHLTGFLFLIATLSSIFHNSLDVLVHDGYTTLFKSLLFLIFASLIVNSKLHLQALMWACVLSVAATAAKQGIKVAVSGGNHVVYGMSSTFNDNNLSAFATLMTIPMCLYLISQHKNSKIFVLGLIGAICSSIIFVLGSDSRGGLLGLLVLFGFYFLKSKHKFLLSTIALILGVFALGLLDDEWFDRMQTITEANEDSSFQGRLIAWKLSILLAIQSPIWGAGFDSVAYGPVWQGVMGYWNLVSFIPSPYPTKGHVAHSIYFQVLGDLGFVGFFLFFGIIMTAYRRFKSYTKLSIPNNKSDWLSEASVYLRLALVCYLVSGAALSVAYNEMTLLLIALAIRFNAIKEPFAAHVKPIKGGTRV